MKVCRKTSQLLFILLLLFPVFFTGKLWAKVDLKRKMKLNESPYYYKAMGDRYRNLGAYPKAIKFYEYALVLKPDFAECYYELGKIKYKKELYVDAIKELESANKKKFRYYFDRIKSYYLLATIYFKIKKEGKAFDILRFLTREYEVFVKRSFNARLIDSKHYAPAYFLIGLYYRNSNKLDKNKLKYFVKSMQLGYKRSFCNYFLYEYYRSKRPDIAFRYLNQAMTINPNIQKDLQEAEWLKSYSVFSDLVLK